MRREENIERLIRRLHFKAGRRMHKRTLNDVLAAQQEAKRAKAAAKGVNIHKICTKSLITKLAVAAMIAMAASLGAYILFGPHGRTDTKEPKGTDVAIEKTVTNNSHLAFEPEVRPEAASVDVELKNIESMFAAGDVEGLVAVLSKGQFESKVAAANYLAKMEAVEALEALKQLSAEYESAANSFAAAVESIENQIKAEQGASEAATATGETDTSTQLLAATDSAAEGTVADSSDDPGGRRKVSADLEDDEEERELKERTEILSGTVVDERGNPLADVRVCASYAHYGRTDPNGEFALVISPTDGSNSMGSADFPMYVWAYMEDDPYRVAWTLIRHPDTHRSQEEEAVVEETHQGVELVIEDEDELNRNVPSDPGELFEDSNRGPSVRDIVLVMGRAGVLAGRVTDALGQPIANATVLIDEMEIQLGANRLIISELDHEWKAEAVAVTDGDGYYGLGNLPVSWAEIKLKAEADGYRTDEQEFENDGRNTVEGCDFQLAEEEAEDDSSEK